MRNKNLKGISPVIATILMVMITVGLVAFSYSWFMGLGQTSQAKVGAQITQMEKAQQSFEILTAYSCDHDGDGDNDVCFQIKASTVNTLDIPTNGTSVYINDAPRDVSTWTGMSPDCSTGPTLKPGESCYGAINNYDCSIGDTLRIVIPWGAEKIRPISGCT
jgi:flagellin-like protein